MITLIICGMSWERFQLKDTKAKFSAVVDQALRGKPSVITRHRKLEARLDAALAAARASIPTRYGGSFWKKDRGQWRENLPGFK
jgi:antitoxin (DNA-binding transcriptional repressor) of toxin-antitoxin stability system